VTSAGRTPVIPSGHAVPGECSGLVWGRPADWLRQGKAPTALGQLVLLPHRTKQIPAEETVLQRERCRAFFL